MSASVQAVLYAAKSSPDEKGSIDGQLKDLRKKAEQEGLEVVGTYFEENESAYSGSRGPELAAAIAHAQRVSGVLFCQHSDRLARGDGKDARHLVEIVLEARRSGFTLRSIQDPSTFDDLIHAVLMGERNFEDSKRKSEATKGGLAKRRSEGKYLGKRSLGYVFKRLSLDDDERTMVIDPTEAATIKRIYDAYRAGHAQLRIARDLMTDGLRTVNGNTEWYQGSVRRILQNPVYAGLIRDGDELIEGVHEAIVPRDEWDEVQDLLAKKAVVYNRGRAPAGIHLFRNAHLRCGECGAAMVPRTEGPRQTYRCNKRNRDSSACGQTEVRRAEVDGAVFAYFAEVALDITATREQMQVARDQKLAEVRALLTAAEREAVEAADAITRIERDYSRGKLDVDEWRRLTANLTPELEGAEAERDRMREQQAQIEAGAAYIDAEAEVVEDLARLRDAIAGKVESAADVEAVRATLVRQFEVFILHRENATPSAAGGTLGPDHGSVYVDDDADGMRWIEPVPSWDSVEGFDAELRPVLTHGPLGQAADNYALSRDSA